MSQDSLNHKSAKSFVGIFRAIYRSHGLTNGYAFTLFKLFSNGSNVLRFDPNWLGFIFSSASFGFILARLQYLDINRRFCPDVPTDDASAGLPTVC
jgi:hypothetical protein